MGAEWGGFRRDDNNQLIVDALSVDSDAETTRQLEAPGPHEQYLIDLRRTGLPADQGWGLRGGPRST